MISAALSVPSLSVHTSPWCCNSTTPSISILIHLSSSIFLFLPYQATNSSSLSMYLSQWFPLYTTLNFPSFLPHTFEHSPTHLSLVGSHFDPRSVHTISRSLSLIILKDFFTYASTIVYVMGSTFLSSRYPINPCLVIKNCFIIITIIYSIIITIIVITFIIVIIIITFIIIIIIIIIMIMIVFLSSLLSYKLSWLLLL